MQQFLTAYHYDDPGHENEGDGESFLYYDSGEDGREVYRERIVTETMNVSVTVIEQPFSAEPWNDIDFSRVKLLIRNMVNCVNEFRLEKEIEKLKFCDDDGYYNLRHYLRFVGRVLGSGRADGKAALRFNIRNFVGLTEKYGRKAADTAMRGFIGGLSLIAGNEGTVCRLGGDNFVALCDVSVPDSLLERLRGADVVCDHDTGEKIRMSASAGVYVLPGNYGAKYPGDIMDKTLSASVAAKEADGPGIVFFGDEGK